MSYYDENTPYYCYSVPAHYYDTISAPTSTQYDDTPSEPSHCVDTSYDDHTPNPPISSSDTYYDDTHSDFAYHVDTPSYDDVHPGPSCYVDDNSFVDGNLEADTWLPPLSPTSHGIENERELEAYAEAAVNRILTLDEIHPAYLNHSLTLPVSESNHPDHHCPPPSSDEIHPAYLNHPPTLPVLNHPDRHCPPLSTTYLRRPVSYHYDDYYWTTHSSANGVKYDPPSDPTFYDTTSHDCASDEDLADTAQRIETVLEERREWDVEDAVDFPELIEERKPCYNQLMHVLQHVKMILRQRKEYDVEEEALENGDNEDSDERKGDDEYPQPFQPPIELQSTPSSHHHTPVFLLAATSLKQRQPRYYFAPIRRRRSPTRPGPLRLQTSGHPNPFLRHQIYPNDPNLTSIHSKTTALLTSVLLCPFP
jgi:hypothetical protein